jgi:hypothetical protein
VSRGIGPAVSAMAGSNPEMCIKTVLTQSIFVCAADIDHRKLSRKALFSVIGPDRKLCEKGRIIVLGKVSRLIASASVAAVLVGCNSLGMGGGESKSAAPTQPDGNAQIMPLAPANPSSNDAAIGTATTASGATARVVQGACPTIYMKDAEAVYHSYAGGAKTGAPEKLAFQATIGNYTRQCTLNEQNLTMTVVAQLRVVAGPAGGPANATLPIRVTVLDGEDTLYSEVTNFPAQIDPNGATQVLFRKDGIKLPVGSGALVRVNIGFDQGAPAKGKGKGKKK